MPAPSPGSKFNRQGGSNLDRRQQLGLQLVMAGPDADTSKLTAVLDSYYDLTRFGPDVFVHWIGVNEQARQLLQSDMPSRHPHLLDAKVQQLSLVGE